MLTWLKAIVTLGGLLQELLKLLREFRRERTLDQAEQTHAANEAAIDRAFRAPALPERLPELPHDDQPRPAPPSASAVSCSESRRP